MTKPRVRRVVFPVDRRPLARTEWFDACNAPGPSGSRLTMEVDRALAAVWPRLQTAVAWLA
jgi:hypothetical protein